MSVQSVVLNAGVKYTTTTCFLTLPCSLYHTNYLHEILPRDPVTPVANVTMHVLGQSQQSWQCWVSKVLARGVVCIDTGANRGFTTATPTLTQVVSRKQRRSYIFLNSLSVHSQCLNTFLKYFKVGISYFQFSTISNG